MHIPILLRSVSMFANVDLLQIVCFIANVNNSTSTLSWEQTKRKDKNQFPLPISYLHLEEGKVFKDRLRRSSTNSHYTYTQSCDLHNALCAAQITHQEICGYALVQTRVFSSFARLHLYFVVRSRAPASAALVAYRN